MDKYLKTFKPAMKKRLAEHYTPEEAGNSGVRGTSSRPSRHTVTEF